MNENSCIWMDGDFVKQDSLNISHLTHGLHYGTGAFEGIRIYNGKAFKLKEHIKRFLHSADVLLMDHVFSATNIEQACVELVERNNIKDGYLRPLVFLGSKSMTIGMVNTVHVMLMCWKRQYPYYDNILKKKSLKLQISSLVKPASDSFPYSAKASGLYVLNHVAKKQAINNGYDDALLLDYRGYISEATTSNFFIVKNDSLITPTTECCLDGITRQLIIEIARQNDIDVNIRHITRDELGDADEVFLTGTVAEINAVKLIEEHEYKNNSVTQLLYSKFYQLTQEL